MRAVGASPRRIWRSGLFWLAILYVLVGAVHAQVVPVLEKPDEDGHYGYILYLREHRALPPLDSAKKGFAQEYKQPPLYYVVTAVLTGWLPSVANPDALLTKNPYVNYSVPGYRRDNRNVFLHPPRMTPLILGARLISLLFGLGTVVASYYLALQLLPRQSLVPVATAAVVGFQPKFMYMATALNNDAALAFFGTLIVLLLVRGLQDGPSVRSSVLLGALLGLGSVTKASGLVFFPLVGLALLLIHRGPSGCFFRDSFIVLAVALAVGGWWYARNALLYGDPLSIGEHVAGRAARAFWDRLGQDLVSIEHTFWANPARTFVSRMWLGKISIWWGRLSLGLLALALVLRFSSLRSEKAVLIVLLSWPVVFLLLLMLYWTDRASWAYGRLLFPAIAPTGLLFVLGWWYVFPRPWRRPVLMFNLAMVVVVGVLVPFVSIYPLYHPWRDLAEESIEEPLGTVYAERGTETPIAQLIACNPLESYVLPGGYLPVELCWKPLAQTDVPYAVFVQLLDLSQAGADGSPGVWGGRRTYPGLGNLPTDRWTPGATFCDRVLVGVSPQAPTPLAASIEVGFIDPETGDRLQPMDAGGHVLSVAVFRGVPVLAPAELPVTQRPAPYTLDGAIALGEVRSGGVLESAATLTLTWQSLRPVPYDATVFVHLRDAGGSLLAQADRQPLDGRFPTSYWLPGQVITDVVRLAPVSEANGGGPLLLDLGMYTWPSLDRLPVVDASGVPLRDSVISIQLPSSDSD
jgi:hypothetical protein